MVMIGLAKDSFVVGESILYPVSVNIVAVTSLSIPSETGTHPSPRARDLSIPSKK
jgi:hypothetical protein